MKHLRMSGLFCFFLLFLFCSIQASADDALLVLYKSSEGSTAEQNIFSAYAQEFVETKGYTVTYHDIEQGLPSEEMTQGVEAIVSVYWGPILANAQEYIQWMAQQILEHRKVIVINNFGAFSPDGETWFDGSTVNQFYHLLGLDFRGNWTNDPNLIEVASKESDMVEFEAEITDSVLTHYFTIASKVPDNQVFLALERTDLEDSESHVVVKTPFGGLAMENYVFAQVDGESKRLLNFEKFLDTCLSEPFPEEKLAALQGQLKQEEEAAEAARAKAEAEAAEAAVTPEPTPTPTPKPEPTGPPILVLYKSSEGSTADNNIFASYIQEFAEAQNYRVRYHDVTTSLPSEEMMQDVYAIVTVYWDAVMANAKDYINWLATQILNRKKVVVINNFGALSPDGSTWYGGEELNTFYRLLGLNFFGNWTNDPDILTITHQNTDLVGYETELTQDMLTHYFTIKSLNPDNEVYLSVAREDQRDSDSHLIVKTPFGGLALENYVFAQNGKPLLDLEQFFYECVKAPFPKDAYVDKPRPEDFEPSPIMVLYKSSEGSSEDQNIFAYNLEALAENLGYAVHYHDVSESLPTEEVMEEMYAVVTVFWEPIMANASDYIDWLWAQVLSNKKIIIINNFGATSPDGQIWYDGLVLNKFYNRLGLEFVGNWTDDPNVINVQYQDPAMIGYDTPLTPDMLTHYFQIKSIRPENESFLTLTRSDMEDSKSQVVVKTPYGGLAMENYVFTQADGTLKKLLNLQRFFQECILEPIPEELRYANDTLMVLYKSSEGTTPKQNVFADHLQIFAEGKGYQIVYHDIEESLPPDTMMQDIYGIVTTYTTSIMANARPYIEWLSQQIVEKRKVLILGNFGAFSPDGETWFNSAVLNRFYFLMGLDFVGNWTDDPNVIEVVSKEPDMVEFEAQLTPDRLTHYFEIKSLKPGNKTFLSLLRNDRKNSESQVVVKTPVGGLAMENYVFAKVGEKRKPLLNFQDFFVECMADPIPKDAVPEKKVLALYKTAEHPTPDDTFIARFLARDLILLGYWPDYVAVDYGIPNKLDMRLYHGIITWFESAFMYKAEEYGDWLLQQIVDGRKVVIFGNYGAFGGTYTDENGTDVQWWVSNTELNHFLYNFGVEFLGNWFGDPEVLYPKKKVSEMVEADLEFTQDDFRHYYHWKSVYDENEVYLLVGRKDLPKADSAFIVRTPFGGFAFEGYIFKSDPETWELNFFVDRHKFLKDCLEYETEKTVEPIPLIPHEEIFAQLREEDKARTTALQKAEDEQDPPAPRKSEIKRKILALYKRDDEPDFSESMTATTVAPVLNHLGFYLDFHAIEDGLPTDEEMRQYHGIFTWFTSGTMPDPDGYYAWLRRQIDKDIKVVIWGDFGCWEYEDTLIPLREVRHFFELMGAKCYKRDYPRPSLKQRIVDMDEDMMNFERRLNLREMTKFEYKIVSEDPDNHVVLRIEDSDAGIIEPIVISENGGFALGDYLVYTTDPMKPLRPKIRRIIEGDRSVKLPEVHYENFWLIDPFKFFKAAYQIEEVPAPDVTTVNGYRIFYSHIDGDGLKGFSRIDQSNYSTYWVMEEIFKKYDLPFSASVITTEIENNPSKYYNRAYTLVRDLYELDNIEAASHTYKHPFKWRTGDLVLELQPDSYSVERLPIQYLEQTEGSMRFIDANLVPPDKKTEIILWSGDCHPDERALGILEYYDRVNMNGGDPIFDEQWNSRTGLAAYSVNYGGFRQVYTSGMNDFMYTSGWTRNFDGMQELVGHFEHTGSPQRLSALNIYYHFYIGDRQEGLDGLKVAYDYCADSDIAPMFASDYAHIVRSYYNTRIFSNDDGSWTVTDNQRLRTIRFDNSLDRYPDFQASSGIIGFGHVNQDLYVYLDESQTHRIAITDKRPTDIYLAWGSHHVNTVTASPTQISFTSHGYGQAEFIWANLAPGSTYQATIIPQYDAPPVTHSLHVDEQGMLTLNHPFLKYGGHYDITLTRQ